MCWSSQQRNIKKYIVTNLNESNLRVADEFKINSFDYLKINQVKVKKCKIFRTRSNFINLKKVKSNKDLKEFVLFENT